MRTDDEERLRREIAYQVWRRVTKTAAILGIVNAALALLLALGVNVTQDQQAAITGIVNALLIAGAAFLDPKVPYIGRGSESANGKAAGNGAT